MQLTLEEKREIVSKNKDPAIAAIQSVLDSYYNILAPYITSSNSLKKDAFKDNEQYRKVAETINNDTIIFENILKRIKEDLPLNKIDIAYIGIAFQFCAIRAESQIKSLQKAHELCLSLSEQLYSELKEES